MRLGRVGVEVARLAPHVEVEGHALRLPPSTFAACRQSVSRPRVGSRRLAGDDQHDGDDRQGEPDRLPPVIASRNSAAASTTVTAG